MFQGVIFDLDGTLLNTIDDLAAAANYTLHQLGFPGHSVQAYKTMVGNGIPKLIERFLPPEYQSEADQARASKLFFSYYESHKQDATAPYPGIPELLHKLRAAGLRLGVVSNKENQLTQEVISHYFPNIFDSIAGHVLGTPAKPDPHLVNLLCSRVSFPKQEILYVGDSNVDILTAHNAGLQGCGVLWGFRSKEELHAAGADYLAANVEELENIILHS